MSLNNLPLAIAILNENLKGPATFDDLGMAAVRGAWEDVRAALAPAWQPIESAPRDGTPILAASVNHEAVEVVCWQDGLPSGCIENLLVDDPAPEEGWVNAGASKDRFYANPRWFTHWQPLPPPPIAKGSEQ